MDSRQKSIYALILKNFGTWTIADELSSFRGPIRCNLLVHTCFVDTRQQTSQISDNKHRAPSSWVAPLRDPALHFLPDLGQSEKGSLVSCTF